MEADDENVYSLGAYQLQSKNFKLNIKFLSDTTGTEINYLPVGGHSQPAASAGDEP